MPTTHPTTYPRHAPILVLLLATLLPSSSARADGDSGEVWVTSQGTDRLFVIDQALADAVRSNPRYDGAKYRLGQVQTVELPKGAGPHLTTFSPLGDYAYISGMGDGKLYVLRADSRQTVATLSLGPAGTHQARPSPDGSVLLVAQIATQSLVKIAADDAGERWSIAGSLAIGQQPATVNKAPICTVFRNDGQRAYVSLLPDGLAIVDVPTMTLLGTLPTDGFVACGMVMSRKGRMVTLASAGSGGHVYRLDTATDTLTNLGTLGAADWHSFALTTDEKVGIGSAPHADALVLVDLTGPTIRPLGTFSLDPTPNMGNDEPDNMAVRGSTVFASLRASGKLAVSRPLEGTVTYLDLAEPAPFNPANCSGCAVHGIAIRP